LYAMSIVIDESLTSYNMSIFMDLPNGFYIKIVHKQPKRIIHSLL
jgi:hypothetical protein